MPLLGTLLNKIDWKQSVTVSIGTTDASESTVNYVYSIVDDGAVSYSQSAASGTGINQYQQVWWKAESIPTGSSFSYNIQSLPIIILEQTFNRNISGIKAIGIESLNVTANQGLVIGATGVSSNPFLHFGTATDVPKSGVICLMAPSGITVDSTNCNFNVINNSDETINYNLAIMGI